MKRPDEVMAALLEKHGIDVLTLVGFACGARCVCSYLTEDNKPCVHCRARLISAEFKAWAEQKGAAPCPLA